MATGDANTTDANDEELHIGVSLSGGGHRASAWALGVYEALLAAGVNDRVTSVVSVSGGSITNGVIANSLDFQTTDLEEFRNKTASLRDTIAHHGLYVNGRPTDRFVHTTVALGGAALGLVVGALAVVLHTLLEVPSPWFLLAGIPFLLVGAKIRVDRAAPIVATVSVTAAVVASASAFGLTEVAARGGSWAMLGAGVVAAAALTGWLFTRQFAQRGAVVTGALDQEFFGGVSLSETGPTPGCEPAVDHIFATTDLEAADPVYLSRQFIGSYRRGITSAAGVTLAEAVQASAALPGAFPPAVLTPEEPFRRSARITVPDVPPQRMPLNDGGVYDNMGDQWDVRRQSGRSSDWAATLQPDLGPVPTLLLVANASAAWQWRPMIRKWFLSWEIGSISRSKGVLYDQTTAVRRRSLIDTFKQMKARGVGQGGVIVMIDRSPFRVCDGFADSNDPQRKGRALEARDLLAAQAGCPTTKCCAHQSGSSCAAREVWSDTVAANAAQGTVLSAIGAERMNSIISQARTSTIVNLYVVHGIGDLSGVEPPTWSHRESVVATT